MKIGLAMLDGLVFIPLKGVLKRVPGSLGENSSSASLLPIFYHFDVPSYAVMIED